jgi:hypothetical protein
VSHDKQKNHGVSGLTRSLMPEPYDKGETSMPRENAYDKGRRYLAEGRLVVSHVDPTFIEGLVRGTGAVHRVAFERGRGWSCTCQALTYCSHLYALMLVTAPEKNGGVERSGGHVGRGPAPDIPDGNSDPTWLSAYAWVTPPEAWALHTAIDPATSDVFPLLGFQVRGQWGGLALAPELLSDITIELGRWLTEYVGALDTTDTNDGDGNDA